MTQLEQQKAAKMFVQNWAGHGYEKGETQKFWIDLLTSVFGVEDISNFVFFEEQVQSKLPGKTVTNFIDAYIPSTYVMIEQKSSSKDLRSPIKQSDGTLLTPFQQARRYVADLPRSLHPKWIVTCNFDTFLVYNMEQPNSEPEEILIKNLEKEFNRLSFLTDTGNVHIKKEMEISIKAGDIVGLLYDKLLAQYLLAKNVDEDKCNKSLNMLCVRLVFCLYAEDAGIFGHKSMFGDYVKQFEARDLRNAILNLFNVLDQKPEDRDPYLEDDLAQFPYVNGGLFTEQDRFIPQFTDEIKELLVVKASEDFDWSEISPTIFGAVFESTLNPETRRKGGMHYTSIENIHKVIDPLFMGGLYKEFDEICEIKTAKGRNDALDKFQKKLGSLSFLDPACGSGNFLTETYLSLRRLENRAIRMIIGDANEFNFDDSRIHVHINQFYGIELNDFAVTVAKTALWIAESQMMKETSEILGHNLEFLPLKTNACIVEGNALQMDWNSIVDKTMLNYIMGNPPFIGKKEQSKEQKAELVALFQKDTKGIGNLDYVSGWYLKAIQLIKDTDIKCAFVSTNSITQGEQVPVLWRYLVGLDLSINFAWRTFQWDSESNAMAHVHCVIIGFSHKNSALEQKFIIDEGKRIHGAERINGYLIDAPDIFIENRVKPLCNVPEIAYGSMPIDDGHLILKQEEVDEILKENPLNAKFIRQYVGGDEIINNGTRYCLWLVDATPNEIRNSRLFSEHIKETRAFRNSSSRPQTKKLAETPWLFGEIRQPDTQMLVIPKVSSERRRYIPVAFIQPEIIVNGSALIIPDATLYEFGILMSNVHNAWMRIVAGRMKSDYQYSGSIVYNNYPWPDPTEEQKAKIGETAKAILDARTKYPDSSLADLYDEAFMPLELRRAHQANDRAVMQAYGFDCRTMSEGECVAELFKLYQGLAK